MTIPTQDGFKIGAQGLPTVRATAPEMADAGVQMTLAGRQAAETGDRLAQMQLKMAQEANELITDDALTRLKDAQMRLRNDPEAGYSRLLGRNALERPDGLSLTDEYDQMLSAFEQEIAAGLKNDAQRQAFAQGANSIRHAFRQELSAHQLRQHQAFVGETAQSNLQSAANVFALADSREEEQAAFMRMTDNLRRLGNIGGWDEATFEAKQREMLSGALGKRLDYLIDRGQLDEAEAVLERYQNLNADLVLKSRDRIEQVRDDEAAEDFGAALAQAMDGQGGAVEIGGGGNTISNTVNKIIGVESGGNANAKNPNSSATGLGQFISSTWLAMVRKYRPDVAAGKSEAQILALRTDPRLGREMTTRYVEENAAVLRQAGQPVTEGNLYLAHFLGSGGALKLLGAADKSQPVVNLVGQRVINANPFLRGKSVQWVMDWTARKMGGSGGRQSVRLPAGMTAQQAEALIGRLPRNQREAARRAMSRQYGVLRRDREEREAAQTVEMMRLVEEAGGDARAIPRSVWSGLDPQQRQRLYDFGDRVRSNREDELFERNKVAYWNFKMNPERLLDHTEAEIQATALDIGYSRAYELLQARRDMQKAKEEGRESSVQVEAGLVNHIAKTYDLKIGGDNPNPEDLRRYYHMAEQVRNLAVRLRGELGREPTNAELYDLAEKMAAEYFITEKRAWFLPDARERLLVMTPEERERMNRIPDNFKQSEKQGGSSSIPAEVSNWVGDL